MNQIVQKLCSGTWSRAYRQMGAHPGRSGGRDGWRFRVWAPNASDVSLAGDFSGWQPLPMVRKDGLWECFVPGAKEFDSYKYVVTGGRRAHPLEGGPLRGTQPDPPRDGEQAL